MIYLHKESHEVSNLSLVQTVKYSSNYRKGNAVLCLSQLRDSVSSHLQFKETLCATTSNNTDFSSHQDRHGHLRVQFLRYGLTCCMVLGLYGREFHSI